MDATSTDPKIARTLGFIGHGALLIGFALVLVTAGGGARLGPITALLLSGGAVLTGIGWIRATPDERLLAKLGGWAIALAPLIAIWVYAALWPTKGTAGASALGFEAAAWLVFAFGLFGGIGVLRIRPRPSPTYLLAGLGLLSAAAMTLAGLVSGGWVLVMIAFILNAAAQALAAPLFLTHTS